MARKRNKEKIISQESGIPGINFGFMSGTGGGYKAPEDPLLVYERDKRKWQKEMVLNDPFIGANLKMISTLGSKGEWKIDNGSGSKKDIKASELIYNILFEDMDPFISKLCRIYFIFRVCIWFWFSRGCL